MSRRLQATAPQHVGRPLRSASHMPLSVARVLLPVMLFLGVSGLVSATPATADVRLSPDSAAACQAEGGVYVYIQNFGSTMGGGCSHAGGNGLRVLESLTSVDFNSSGLICRIGGHPSDCSEQPMPYWSYWLWNGSSWVYATRGAVSRTPSAGSVEAWNYSNTAPPSVRPPAQPALPASAATQNPAASSASSGSAAENTDNDRGSSQVSSEPTSANTAAQTPWASLIVMGVLVAVGVAVAVVLRRRRTVR